MINPLPFRALGLAGLAVAWGVAASAQDLPQDLSEAALAHHAEALAMFDVACMRNLPGFDEAENGFETAGLSAGRAGFWRDDAAGFIAKTTSENDDRQRGCFVALSEADIAALSGALGQLMENTLGAEAVGIMRGPLPGDPPLFLAEQDGYVITAVAANVSEGYGMLTVSVEVPEDATPPWAAP